MPGSITIEKHPSLPTCSDYELLRSKGLEYIQQLGSKLWTDYNVHDPGITILEALCYAITDLGYKASFNIKDLLADAPTVIQNPQRQAFYTAREILTVNPCTINDYRKLLIDVDGIKNAWLQCKTCACDDIFLYANCKDSVLQYQPTANHVIIKGLYDVLIEFEDEEKTGNLNSGKIKYNFTFPYASAYATAEIELRLSSWFELEENKDAYTVFRNTSSIITQVDNVIISGTTGDNVDIPTVPDSIFDNALRRSLYVTANVTFAPDKTNTAITQTLLFEDVPLRVWLNTNDERKSLLLDDLRSAFTDVTAGGIFPKYLDKIKKADAVIATAKNVLHDHRNLCEDYCSIKAIEVEDIAVCADMEVIPSADIEAVLAQAYYLIDEYFSPDIKFYSLQQLLDDGKTPDEIFEGPALSNGFIDDEQLESTNLKRVLNASDIINLLMEIKDEDGINLVTAVKNLTLVRYDKNGNILSPVQPWQLSVSLNHQPRLYIEACKVLVYKNGLPFLPDRLELNDTLQVIKGQHAQPKYSVTENDLQIPRGNYYNFNDYYPVQYSLPLTYGIGYEGLPSSASDQRKAQAKQLKAYFMFYEQLLVNYLQQLSHIKDLFAVDTKVVHTYYSALINNDTINNITDLYNVTSDELSTDLSQLSETQPEFLERRNRFLNHLLSRFAEDFNNYALMLYSYIDSKPLADSMLIQNKILFLKDIPFMSVNRAKAFNYYDAAKVCTIDNIAGLKKRIMRLLGLGAFSDFFNWYDEYDANKKLIGYRWHLTDDKGETLLISNDVIPLLSGEDLSAKLDNIIQLMRDNITDASHYTITEVDGSFELSLLDDTSEKIAYAQQKFDSAADATIQQNIIIAFAERIFTEEKIFIVEHLLLRPRNNPPATFQLYEEKDTDGKFYERRWRLINKVGHIYLSASTRYVNTDFNQAQALADAEIIEVCKRITNVDRYQIKKDIKWTLNLVDETGEVIATRKQHFATEEAATAARDELIALAKGFTIDGDLLLPDELLPVCLSSDCNLCGEEDPYSFRLTVILSGEEGIANSGIEFRRFAEQTIRMEVPAHIGVKICWVKKDMLENFATVYCAWLTELAKPEPDKIELNKKLTDLLNVFNVLKNVYPPATLHDCLDGNDENRVFLGSTNI